MADAHIAEKHRPLGALVFCLQRDVDALVTAFRAHVGRVEFVAGAP